MSDAIDQPGDARGEQNVGDEVKPGLISGRTFRNQEVRYTPLDGMALFEGDIILGTVEQMEKNRERGDAPTPGTLGVVVAGEEFRWPGGRVPFRIHPQLSAPQRVRDAIAHWEQHTNIRFIELPNGNPAGHPNFITFVSGGGCLSHVGMQGGEQEIILGPQCTVGNAIHEIGHALGLWHEQSRADRDGFITIRRENIQPGREHNFDQHIVDGDDVGDYDYVSIMHYPRDAFSRNGQDTIVPNDEEAAADMGQRRALSQGDINAVRAIYPEIH